MPQQIVIEQSGGNRKLRDSGTISGKLLLGFSIGCGVLSRTHEQKDVHAVVGFALCVCPDSHCNNCAWWLCASAARDLDLLHWIHTYTGADLQACLQGFGKALFSDICRYKCCLGRFRPLLSVIWRYLALSSHCWPCRGPFRERYFAIFAVTSAVWGGSGRY